MLKYSGNESFQRQTRSEREYFERSRNSCCTRRYGGRNLSKRKAEYQTICVFALIVTLSHLAAAQSSVFTCQSDADCKTQVDPYSSCRPGGICSTNPYEQGCLYRHGLAKKMRVCNSDDDPGAAAKELCRLADIQYPEVRIFSNNWESAIMETWILQIILSELLEVPTSAETGTYGTKVNFYNHWEALDFGIQDAAQALQRAGILEGDCGLAKQYPDEYQSCAHLTTEVWESRELWDVDQNIFEKPPQPLGVLGQEGWFLPKFTGRRDPSLLSYLGLQGEENRQKLADRFLRPTSWKEYCDEVSNSSCLEPDEVALRPPLDSSEHDRYFVENEYTGYFRKTEENDCEKWPLNCTGHIVDYPCGWGSFTEQQAYHLGIALQSSGREPGSRGYSYPQMLDIWMAANATESDVMMVWWFPEQLHQRFVGTSAEFLKVTLPPVTQECIDARVTIEERCSSDFKTRVGDAAGACDEHTKQIYKVLSTGLSNMNFHKSIPSALHSPAYEAVKAFQVTSPQLSQIFSYWLNASDPREGICKWVVDNMVWASEFIPDSYPRTLTARDEWDALRISALGLAVLTTLLTFAALIAVYCQRRRRVMVFAQVEFLWLILSGLLVVSLGAVINAIPPTNGSCVASIWFVLAGYTLELVPLCTKLSVINRLMHASASLKRFVVQWQSLFGVVAAISAVVMLYLLVWTLIDPPRRQAVYELTDSKTPDQLTEIDQQFFCASSRSFWTYISLTWVSFLLVCATVLAFQTRGIREEFNESQTLALMIYSHSVFVLLRVVSVLFLPGALDEPTLAVGSSIILSIDTLATLSIYFLPKFMTTDDAHRRSSLSHRASHNQASSWMLTRSDMDKIRLDVNNRSSEDNNMECIRSVVTSSGKDGAGDLNRPSRSIRQRHPCLQCHGSGYDAAVSDYCSGDTKCQLHLVHLVDDSDSSDRSSPTSDPDTQATARAEQSVNSEDV